jgi:hypothetical protein
MPYTTKHDPLLDIIEVTCTGLITEADIRLATSQAISTQKQMGTTSFLIDIVGWNLSASFTDIYEVVSTQYLKEEAHRQSRIAVVMPPSMNVQEAVHFYETVCFNRGWRVRVCSDRQSAIDWLRSTTTAPD